MLSAVDEVHEKLKGLPEAAHSGSTASLIYLSKDKGRLFPNKKRRAVMEASSVAYLSRRLEMNRNDV